MGQLYFMKMMIFDSLYKAVTPGQAAVFYDENGMMLGGGLIDKVFYKGKVKNY